MHGFRDMTTQWSKIANKTYPILSFGTFLWGDSLRIFRRLIPCQKLESWGYQVVYISRSCFRSARHNTGVWQTDRRTDRQTDWRTIRCRKDRAMPSVARVKTILGNDKPESIPDMLSILLKPKNLRYLKSCTTIVQCVTKIYPQKRFIIISITARNFEAKIFIASRGLMLAIACGFLVVIFIFFRPLAH